MKDNKGIKALSDEELENIDGGKMSEGAILATVIGGSVLITAAIAGITLAVADASVKKNAKKLGMTPDEYRSYYGTRLTVEEFRDWKASGLCLGDYYNSKGKDITWMDNVLGDIYHRKPH